MILITEFMDEVAVERLKTAKPTNYAPELADSQGDIPAMMTGIKALIVRNRTKVTKELLDAAPDLQMVGRLGVGLDNIDLVACKEKGVKVFPAIGANTLSVAEYVIGNALILLRNAYQVNTRMLNGEWPRGDCSGREMAGRKLGLIGFGAIAQETARLAKGMGMEIIAYDPHLPTDHQAWQMASAMSLDEVLANSDVISLHVPLNEATKHLINKQRLNLMKSDAVLINAARGGVVDETELANAIREGQIAGAALDVFENEPLDKASAKIFAGLENLILTPHIAGVTEDSNQRVSAMIADLVLDHIT